MEDLIKPITLTIDREVWNRFKTLVPRDITLNDSLVYLINSYINNKEVNQNGE